MIENDIPVIKTLGSVSRVEIFDEEYKSESDRHKHKLIIKDNSALRCIEFMLRTKILKIKYRQIVNIKKPKNFSFPISLY